MPEQEQPSQPLTPEPLGRSDQDSYRVLVDPKTTDEQLAAWQAGVVANRVPQSPDKPLTRGEEEKIDAGLRKRHPQPSLTPADVAELEKHRGQFVPQVTIDGINNARARGIHTGI